MTNVSPLPIWQFDDWSACQPIHAKSAAVYPINLTTPLFELSTAWPLLSEAERRRADAFIQTEHRDRYVQIHAVLRKILAYHTELTASEVAFEYNKYGKPSLTDYQVSSPIEFNLSHSGNHALLAVAKHKMVGVDIELIDQNIDFEKIAQHSFTAGECALIFDQPRHQQRSTFYRLWTAKESFVKALGKGMSLPFNRFELALSNSDSIEIINTDRLLADNKNWTVCTLPCEPGFIAALTLSKD